MVEPDDVVLPKVAGVRPTNLRSGVPVGDVQAHTRIAQWSQPRHPRAPMVTGVLQGALAQRTPRSARRCRVAGPTHRRIDEGVAEQLVTRDVVQVLIATLDQRIVRSPQSCALGILCHTTAWRQARTLSASPVAAMQGPRDRSGARVGTTAGWGCSCAFAAAPRPRNRAHRQQRNVPVQ